MHRSIGSEIFGYGSAAIGLLGVVVAAGSPEMEPGMRKVWGIGFGAGTAAFGLSLAAGRDTRIDVLQTLVYYNGGVVSLAGVVSDDAAGHSSPTTWAGASVAFFTEAVLVSINSIARTTKTSTLRSAKARLASGKATKAELDTIERQLLAADVPIGHLVLATPFGIGALIAVAPALDEKSNSSEKTWAAVVGGTLFVTGILAALTVDIVPHYRDGLYRSGLTLTASPTRVGLGYRF